MGAPGIFIRGYGRGVWDYVFKKLKQFADIVYRFWLYRNDRNVQISHNFLLIFASMFHGGAKWHFRGLRPFKGIRPCPLPGAAADYHVTTPDRNLFCEF